MRCAALNRVEVGEVESADATSIHINPCQRSRIAPWYDFACDSIDRRVLVTPPPSRSNGEAMPNIDNTEHLELSHADLDLTPRPLTFNLDLSPSAWTFALVPGP